MIIYPRHVTRVGPRRSRISDRDITIPDYAVGGCFNYSLGTSLKIITTHCLCYALCCVRYISCKNAAHEPAPVQKIYQDRYEATMDQHGPEPEARLVLTLYSALLNHADTQ